MLILHNVSMCAQVCVRVCECVERESVSEESYENHVRHASGMTGEKSSLTMNETLVGEEKGGGGGCEEHNEEKEVMR